MSENPVPATTGPLNVYDSARAVLQLESGIAEATAERDRLTAECAAIEERIEGAQAYEQALETHIAELEATLDGLRQAIPPAQQEVDTVLMPQRSEISAGRKVLADMAQQRWQLKQEIDALQADVQRLRNEVSALTLMTRRAG